MNFYLIIPASSVDIGGRFTKYKTTRASIYHIYKQTPNKTEYNVFRPSYLPNLYPWPRKKLTRKTLDECFNSSMFCMNIKADNIDELVKKINILSDICVYRVVI